jgi:hypothetical protein
MLSRLNINQYNNFTKNLTTTNIASKRSEFQGTSEHQDAAVVSPRLG